MHFDSDAIVRVCSSDCEGCKTQSNIFEAHDFKVSLSGKADEEHCGCPWSVPAEFDDDTIITRVKARDCKAFHYHAKAKVGDVWSKNIYRPGHFCDECIITTDEPTSLVCKRLDVPKESEQRGTLQ